jgi:endonuclease/exonuclease/phosphatase family metal-dependent hydrolase
MAAALAACAYRVPAGVPATLSCLGGGSAVAWRRAAADRRLDWWCARVGPPLVRDVAASGRIDALVIVSWNVHVGAGRVDQLLERLPAAGGPAARGIGIVLLLQEAFRSGGEIPIAGSGGAVPDRIAPPADALDVDAMARRLGMAVAYVPSMRNGGLDVREDRGTAILSTEPLSDVTAIELPFGRQRRVATSAMVHPRGGAPLRMISAHLDSVLSVGGQRRQAQSLATYLSSLVADGPPVVVAVDTNARLGRHDRTVETIAAVLPALSCRPPVVPLRVLETDFLFTNLERGRVRSCRVEPAEYGSDHRPLVMIVPVR